MTLTDIISRVRSVIRDSAGTFISDTEITEWANEAQLELAVRMRLLQEEDTEADLTEGTNTITTPATFLAQSSLRIGTDDVEFVSDDVWNSWADSETTPDHTIARVFDDLIELYPTPSSGFTYKLRYQRKPAVLINGSDTPEIPEHLHIKLLHYCRYNALLAMGELQQANTYIGLYEQGVGRKGLPDRKWMTTPGQMVVARGPFDTDDASHF